MAFQKMTQNEGKMEMGTKMERGFGEPEIGIAPEME